MTVVADAGPLPHLYWVGALDWALPRQDIIVVDEVWQEASNRPLLQNCLNGTSTAES